MLHFNSITFSNHLLIFVIKYHSQFINKRGGCLEIAMKKFENVVTYILFRFFRADHKELTYLIMNAEIVYNNLIDILRASRGRVGKALRRRTSYSR